MKTASSPIFLGLILTLFPACLNSDRRAAFDGNHIASDVAVSSTQDGESQILGDAANEWQVAFLQRTPSEPIKITAQSNLTISGLQFVDFAVGTVAITIEDCDNITITENDFANVTGGIYVLNSTNVTVTRNRYQNIGDGTIGSGHSNFVQFNNTRGGRIAHNKGKGGNTEDIISVYQSGGASAESPLIIEYNAFEGTDWSSHSGSAIMLGDGGGSHTVARFNRFLTPGQAGIGVASGTDMHITDNILYGAQRPAANVGIYVWNQYPFECADIEVARNQSYWFNEAGMANPFWDGENCGEISGEESNLWQVAIDPETLAVEL